MLKPSLHSLKTELSFSPWPSFSPEEIEKAKEILISGKVNYWTGEEGRFFEEEYARAVGTKYAVAVMNGTVALEAALVALNVGPGDEVITTCRTFIASASCIVMRGAKPILADVDEESQNLTVESIKRVITQRTKAIIVVHVAGWPCDMPAIMSYAKANNLYVIEDCAQAHGAKWEDKEVGSFGDIAAFSFCQDKIISSGGEGGMVTTNHKDLWEKVWSLKDHGKSYVAVNHKKHPIGFRWLHESFGTNWRMTEIQAAIGRIQLRNLANSLKSRRDNAEILTQHFKKIAAFRVTTPPRHVYHAYYKYYVFLREKYLQKNWNRDRILQDLLDKGIPVMSGICSEIYLEKAFIDKKLSPNAPNPVAKRLGESSLMFPVHPTLSEDQMMKMVEGVQKTMLQAMSG